MCAYPNLATYKEEPLRFERTLTDPPVPFKGLAARRIDRTNEATQRPLRDILGLDHYEFAQWDDTAIADLFADTVARNRFVDALIKSQERRVFEAGERFRLAIESFPTAVVLADDEGKIVLLNRRTIETFGYKREDLLGRTIEMLIPQCFGRFHNMSCAEVATYPPFVSTGNDQELYGVRKDDCEFPIEFTLSPIRVNGGLLILCK